MGRSKHLVDVRAVWVGFAGSGSPGLSSTSLENHFRLTGHTIRKNGRTSEEALGLGLQKATFVTGGWGSSGNGKLTCSL